MIALIPDRTGGYRYLDETSGRRVKLDRNTKREIEEEALCFYKPLPVKPIGIPELMGYIAGTLSVFDVGMFLAAALGITLLGMVSPKLNHIIFSRVTASGNMRLFLSITFFLVCLRVSALLAEVVRSMLMQRIGTKMGIQVQAAVMMRILSLPTDFFGSTARENWQAGRGTSIPFVPCWYLWYFLQALRRYSPWYTLPRFLPMPRRWWFRLW